MKILFLSLGGTFPFRIGGPSVVAYNLVREFDKKGVEVDFVFGISKEHLSKTSSLSRLFGFSDNIHLTPVVKNERSPESYRTSLDFKSLKDIIALSKKLNNRLDLIHFHWTPNTRDVLIPFLAKLKNIPMISRQGGWATYETFVARKEDLGAQVYFDYFTYRFLNRFFTKIICNSLYLKQKLVSDGISKEKIEVIPNGVSIERFKNPKRINLSGDPALLFVGRLEYIKGVDLLVKSMKIIAKELPDAVLHIVGEGKLMNQLKSFVKFNGLGRRVIFHGRITWDLPSFYNSADICVFPSLYEPFGITIIEAMAAGKPLIATKRGGIPEFIRNFENGILIEPEEENLKKAIIDLWNKKDLMKLISKNNLEKSRYYDWTKIAELYIKSYTLISQSFKTDF